VSGLNELLDLYAPPSSPDGLASRAAAAAVAQLQPKGVFAAWRRGSGRGAWKRGAIIGSAALGLAFTSAVAAEVVSGGDIQIPVVHQVVEAVPILKATTHARDHRTELASAERKPRPKSRAEVPVDQPSVEPIAPQAPTQPMRQRALQRFQKLKERVAERRAEGLPTPYADRLERQAKRIVERRHAGALPTPSLDQVEAGLALRQARQRRLLRQMARDPSAITDTQIEQLAIRLPPEKRERFLALSPDMRRQMIQRRLQRMQQRRASMQMRNAPQQSANPQPQSTNGAEPQTQQPSEGFSEPPR
jgi:hypothetical protein